MSEFTSSRRFDVEVLIVHRVGNERSTPLHKSLDAEKLLMLLLSLTCDRVAILVKGHVDQPSDASGIIYLHFNDHVREVVPKLAERLRGAGFDIDASRIARATS